MLDEPAFIERLIEVADGPPAEVATGLDGLDPDRVAAALLTEVAARAELHHGPSRPLTVQFLLCHNGHELAYRLTVGGEAGKVEPGREADPWVTIRQDLAELLGQLYGPPGTAGTATREVLMKDEPGPKAWFDDPWQAQRDLASLAVYQVLAACAEHRLGLTELAARFGSDKFGGHWYTPHYEHHFAPWRDRRLRILEIGIGGYQAPDLGGESLRMWKHYFTRGLVYGLDIYDKSAVAQPRVRVLRGSQSDPEALARIVAEHGPFDVIVDDGSHVNSDVLASFDALFPTLAPGGLYVVEDVQTSYWPGAGGSSDDLDRADTSMVAFKRLVDGLNHREMLGDRAENPSPTDNTVVGVHFYHNLVFVQKGRNAEQPAPGWVSRTQDITSYVHGEG